MLNTNWRAQKVLHFFCQYHYSNDRLFFDTQKIQDPQFSVQKLGGPPDLIFRIPTPNVLEKSWRPHRLPSPLPAINNGWSLKFLLSTTATFAECVAARSETPGGTLQLHLYGGVWPQDWKIDPSAD